MTKIKAALSHLLISMFVIGLFILIVLFIWYPSPFTAISGVFEPLKLLIIVDVIIGPILTFIIYKKNKKGLMLDITLIVMMQLAALFYGIHIIKGGRPNLVVLHNGTFHYLSEKFSKNQDLKFDELKPSLFSKPKMAYILNTQAYDIYNAYSDIQPINDYETILLPHSLNSENMKAKYKSKVDAIDALESKYKDEEIVYFLLNKEELQYYIVYSVNKNTILDYLKF